MQPPSITLSDPPMQAEVIKHLIETGLQGAIAHIEGDGTHFTAQVVWAGFANKSRVQKQQCVNETLKAPLLDGTLHAISIQTFTPEEWQQWKN